MATDTHVRLTQLGISVGKGYKDKAGKRYECSCLTRSLSNIIFLNCLKTH